MLFTVKALTVIPLSEEDFMSIADSMIGVIADIAQVDRSTVTVDSVEEYTTDARRRLLTSNVRVIFSILVEVQPTAAAAAASATDMIAARVTTESISAAVAADPVLSEKLPDGVTVSSITVQEVTVSGDGIPTLYLMVGGVSGGIVFCMCMCICLVVCNRRRTKQRSHSRNSRNSNYNNNYYNNNNNNNNNSRSSSSSQQHVPYIRFNQPLRSNVADDASNKSALVETVFQPTSLTRARPAKRKILNYKIQFDSLLDNIEGCDNDDHHDSGRDDIQF
jgi:hypothetical protein